MKKFGRTKKIMGYDDGGEVSPDQLSENDFTKPGEMIPKEGGLGNFIKYNLAHRTPEDAMQMGMGAAGIENVGKELPMALEHLSPESSQAMQRALNDLKDKLRYSKPPTTPEMSIPEAEMPSNDLTGPVRPDYAKGEEEAMKQYNRKVPGKK